MKKTSSVYISACYSYLVPGLQNSLNPATTRRTRLILGQLRFGERQMTSAALPSALFYSGSRVPQLT